MTNTIAITGRLGRDAELRYTKNGRPVLELAVADSRSRRTQNGDWEEARPTIWHKATVWGALAEMWANSQLLSKGAEVDIAGELTIREYEHNGEKRWESTINVKQLGVREPRNSNSGGGQQNSFAQTAPVNDPWFTDAQGGFSDPSDPNSPPF